MKRFISILIIITFLIDSSAFGLGPGVVSDNIGNTLRPDTRNEMHAAARRHHVMKYGPGIEGLDKYRFKGFQGKKPEIAGVEFVKASYDIPPDAWNNNPLLAETDLVEALEYFRDNEAEIPADRLKIEMGSFEVDEEEGELPIARLMKRNDKYVLVVHEKFVRIWNDIRENDVWYECDLEGEKRTVSVAWSIFYRLAKHEMMDLVKETGAPKGWGHVGFPRDEVSGKNEFKVDSNEISANLMAGKYGNVNDAAWMWLLHSYCFGATTRYDNKVFYDRLDWVFTGKDEKAREAKLYGEFPRQYRDPAERESTIKLACAINYEYFSRQRIEVLKPVTASDETINLSVAQDDGDKTVEVAGIKGSTDKVDIKGSPVYAAEKYRPEEYDISMKMALGYYLYYKVAGSHLNETVLDRLYGVYTTIFSVIPRSSIGITEEEINDLRGKCRDGKLQPQEALIILWEKLPEDLRWLKSSIPERLKASYEKCRRERFSGFLQAYQARQVLSEKSVPEKVSPVMASDETVDVVVRDDSDETIDVVVRGDSRPRSGEGVVVSGDEKLTAILSPEDLLRSAEKDKPRDQDQEDDPVLAAMRGHFPGYEIKGKLGEGGFGAVLLARESLLKRDIALKTLTNGDDTQHDRFMEEALITAQLQHPGVVPIYQIGKDDSDHYFYTMRPIEGEPLNDILDKLRAGDRETARKYELRDLVRVIHSVCDTLNFAHDRGVIHRDLKPANIVVGEYGEVLLIDWGLAKVIGRDEDAARDDVERTGDVWEKYQREVETLRADKESSFQLTMEGTLQGTPTYMSPEQFLGIPDEIDRQSDIWEIGVILYEVATLMLPFKAEKLRELMRKIEKEDPVDPGTVNPRHYVSPELAEIITKCLKKEKSERYATIKELADDLGDWLDGVAPWKQVTDLDFSKMPDGDLEGWTVNYDLADDGKWFVRDGAMQHTGINETVILLDGPADGDVRVEMEVMICEDKEGEISPIICAPLSDKPGRCDDGYYLEFGADDRSNKAKLAKNSGDVTEVLSDDVNMTRGKWHNVVAEKAGRKISLTVDGKEVFAYWDYIPLSGNHVGLYTWGNGLRVRSFKVYHRGAGTSISCLDVPNAFFNKGQVETAKEQYLQIAENHRGKREGWEALFLAGLCIIELAKGKEDEEKESMLREAEEVFDRIKKSPFAPLGALGRSYVLNLLEEYEDEIYELVRAYVDYRGYDKAEVIVDRLLERKMIYKHTSSPMPLLVKAIERFLNSYSVSSDNIYPLNDLPINALTLSEEARDINGLRGMELSTLDLSKAKLVEDISPLRGMPLTSLSLPPEVRDMSALEGMPLTSLDASGTKIDDISALEGRPLLGADLSDTKIRDISPLEGMPIISLNISGLELSNISVLLSLPNPEELVISPEGLPEGWQNIVRQIKTLKILRTENDPEEQTPEEFWEKHGENEEAGLTEAGHAEESHSLLALFAARIRPDIGPGSKGTEGTLSGDENDVISMVAGYLANNGDNIEILLPQGFYNGLTDPISQAIRDLNRRKGKGSVKCKPYLTASDLKRLLVRKTEGAKRMIITTGRATRGEVKQLARDDISLFRDQRILNIDLPGGYADMGLETRTVHQAKILTIAVFARLLNEGETIGIKVLLTEILTEHMDLDEHELKEFLDRLARAEEGNAAGEIMARVTYFLDRAISLVKVLEKEIRIMEAFWNSA